MALIPVPPGQVAAVLTRLEMRAPPPRRPLPPSALRLERWRAPDSARYRALFKRIGTPWLWFSRLALPDADLRRILDDPAVEVSAAVDPHGVEVGFLELDFRGDSARADLSYFGLVPELVGQGHGGWLMAHALAMLWRPGVRTVTVSTCSLDHPRALGFYRHHGFVPVSRSLESFPDPRLAGLLDRAAAPHVPVIGG